MPSQSQQDSDSSKRQRSDAFAASPPVWQGGNPRKELGQRVLLQALTYTKQALADAIWKPFQVSALQTS